MKRANGLTRRGSLISITKRTSTTALHTIAHVVPSGLRRRRGTPFPWARAHGYNIPPRCGFDCARPNRTKRCSNGREPMARNYVEYTPKNTSQRCLFRGNGARGRKTHRARSRNFSPFSSPGADGGRGMRRQTGKQIAIHPSSIWFKIMTPDTFVLTFVLCRSVPTGRNGVAIGREPMVRMVTKDGSPEGTI